MTTSKLTHAPLWTPSTFPVFQTTDTGFSSGQAVPNKLVRDTWADAVGLWAACLIRDNPALYGGASEGLKAFIASEHGVMYKNHPVYLQTLPHNLAVMSWLLHYSRALYTTSRHLGSNNMYPYGFSWEDMVWLFNESQRHKYKVTGDAYSTLLIDIRPVIPGVNMEKKSAYTLTLRNWLWNNYKDYMVFWAGTPEWVQKRIDQASAGVVDPLEDVA